MTRPLYYNHGVAQTPPRGGNGGLWWEKFFDGYSESEDWTVGESAKTTWIATVGGLRGRDRVLEKFGLRQYELGMRLKAQQKVFKTDWRFATGLGLSHPVENGFAWHPTLGVPYLPASSIKGLLRGWVEQWQFSEADTVARDDKIRRWFGSNDKDQEKAGDLIFFDAVPLARVEVGADVMTPHMGKWYEQGSQIKGDAQDAKRLPADWHSPVPVVFLVVKNGSFLFQIAPRGRTAASEAVAAMEQLQLALSFLGAGAKTAVGYGRLSEDTKLHAKFVAQMPRIPVIEFAEELVTMVSLPYAGQADVELESGDSIPCRGLDPIESAARWESGDTLFLALVRREDGKTVSAEWKEWG